MPETRAEKSSQYNGAHQLNGVNRKSPTAKSEEAPDAPTPMQLANLYLDEWFSGPDGIQLRSQNEQFFWWDGRVYNRLPTSELDTLVLGWLDGKVKSARPRHAKDIVACLHSQCLIPFNVNLPVMETDSGFVEGGNLVSMQNGIIELDEAIATTNGEPITIRNHTSKWICEFALPYAYDAKADCPTWFAAIHEMFNGDIERVDLLQEWFGYCIADDTSLHAILILEGPPRSGKGTILRQLEHVVGHDNCVSPRLMSLGENFGLSTLLGKRVAICPDAHLGHGDKALTVLETLKSISGEDTLSIDRKFRDSVNVRLRTRFALAVNELPKFGDGANALASRVMIIPMTSSFLGREDRSLEGKLQAEAPGVFLWALDGLRRLRQVGRFTVPAVSAAILKDFARLTSPVHAFIEDRCDVGSTYTVRRDDFWAAWKRWCEDNGNLAGSMEKLGAMLRTQILNLGDTRLTEGGIRARYYTGVKLK